MSPVLGLFLKPALVRPNCHQATIPSSGTSMSWLALGFMTRYLILPELLNLDLLHQSSNSSTSRSCNCSRIPCYGSRRSSFENRPHYRKAAEYGGEETFLASVARDVRHVYIHTDLIDLDCWRPQSPISL
jgi:hypothetical protein